MSTQRPLIGGSLAVKGAERLGRTWRGVRSREVVCFLRWKKLESVCMFLGMIQEERERKTDALGVRGPKRQRSRAPREHLPRCNRRENDICRGDDELASEGFYFLQEVSGGHQLRAKVGKRLGV